MEVDSSSSDFWVMVAALKVCETILHQLQLDIVRSG